MRTLKEEYEREKKLRLQDAECIRTATGYTNSYLKWGNVCDSSDRNTNRINFVLQAEEKFLKDHTKDILELAAQMCHDSVGE